MRMPEDELEGGDEDVGGAEGWEGQAVEAVPPSRLHHDGHHLEAVLHLHN